MPALDDLERDNPEYWQRAEAETARRMAEIREDRLRLLKRVQDQRLWFETSLYRQWQPAFDFYDLCLDFCKHQGFAVYEQYRESAHARQDHRFFALSALQSRACVATAAIQTLLRSGFAQDASAHWRSLLEITVAAVFVRRHGQDVAERFILHEVFERAKLAEQLQASHAKAGQKFHSDDELERIRVRKAELISRYGKPFATQYGWASDALSRARPTIEDIERAVGWENFRPDYRIASFGVHPGYMASTYNISLPADVRLRLWGPSNYGIAEVADATLEMLTICTGNFLMLRSSEEMFLTMRLCKTMSDAAREEFRHIYERAGQEPATKSVEQKDQGSQ